KNQSTPKVVSYSLTNKSVQNVIEALGTTLANESVNISSSVTEKVGAFRFEDGEAVKKGQILIELNNEEQKAQLKIAEVDLAEQRREYLRIENLVKNKSVSRSELERLQSLIDTALARIEEVKATLNDRIIRAPFSGVLGFREISVGALLQPGDVITTLDDIDVLKVDFDVPEVYLGRLNVGKEIVAHAKAFPNIDFKGRITVIGSRANPSTRSITMRAIIENPQKLLKPGMLLTIDVIHEQRTALMVPEQALIMRGSQHFVYQISNEKTVTQKPVEVGLRQNGEVEIVKGLNEGDSVVLYGHLKIKEGIKVDVQDEQWRGGQA
ncbi:MAG: efflux RND transporter periplasmic adaptor subunit, partial [Pseudomonadota bacterium]